MVTAEVIYEKAKLLDSITLQEVADFLDFVAYKRKADFQKLLEEKRQYFPETKLKLPRKKPAYTTKTLTLEDMDAAIEEQAGLHK
jgi:hypothetical protein